MPIVSAVPSPHRTPRRLVMVSGDRRFAETMTIRFRSGQEFSVFHCPVDRACAAQEIARVGFDAVLIDDDGADGEALDLIRELRGRAADSVIFVLSGEADQARRQRIFAAGATALIAKTILAGVLVTLVRETLDGNVVLAA